MTVGFTPMQGGGHEIDNSVYSTMGNQMTY